MPSKCNKVKNPCKICLETVSNKTGLQCQGACKKWVHFSCLNYTPGKIKDIKQGIIKVTCPCPDCKTSAPKEYRTDEPFGCTNIQCPSNLPRSCASNTCPSNINPNSFLPPPLLVCEKDSCKQNKMPFGVNPPSPHGVATSCPSFSSGSNRSYTPECPHVKGDSSPVAGQALNVVEQLCTTVGQLSNQINCLMKEMKTMLGANQGKLKSCPRPPSSQDNRGQPTSAPPHPVKDKPCHCPGNPRR